MVTQMNSFFPVPELSAGKGAIPALLAPATGQTTPFTQVLTQQTQAQTNPLMLAFLNGMTGLSPQISATNTPAVPTINADMPSEIPGQEAASATPDANLLALAGISMTPLILPNAVPIIALNLTQTTPNVSDNMPVPSQMTATVPSVDVTAGQNPLPSGAEDIAVLVSQLQAAPNTNTAQIVPQPAPMTLQTAPQSALVMPQTEQNSAPAASQISLAEPNTAQIVSSNPMPQPAAQTALLATHNAMTAEQLKTNIEQPTAAMKVLNLASNPNRQTETETTLAPNILAIVAEPSHLGQNAPKQIAALPMDTERAIAFSNVAIAPTTSQNPTDTDASTEGDSHETETLAALAHTAERTPQPAGMQTFGDTLQRLESTGSTASANAETVKPDPTDRYEVTAQVTKHLETLTAAGGRSELIIQLKPEHLGQIRIILSTSENGLSAKIVSDSMQAQTALNGAKESLRAAFEQRGLTLDTLDVTLNQQAFGNSQQAFAGMQMGYGQTQPQQMRPVTGSLLPEDEIQIPATVAAVPARNNLNRLDFRA